VSQQPEREEEAHQPEQPEREEEAHPKNKQFSTFSAMF
jgi:hypothetical protein